MPLNEAAHPALEAAPLLKAGVLHAQVDGGSYIEWGERSFFVRGEKLYPVLVRMLDSFDGTRPLAALRAAMPEKVAPLFEELLAQLRRHRMLTSGPEQAIADDTPFASTLRYMREATPRWRECADAWREARISLVGPPAWLARAGQALVDSGAGTLVLVPWSDADAQAAPIEDDEEDDAGALAALARLADRHAGVVVGDLDAVAAQSPTPGSLLLGMTRGRPDAQARARWQALARAHATTIGAADCGGAAFVGPDCGADLAPWFALIDRAHHDADTAALPFTRAARRVWGTLPAFEALQACIAAWSDDPDEAAGRRSRFCRVRPDGSVGSHDLAVYLAGGAGAHTAQDAPAGADAAAGAAAMPAMEVMPEQPGLTRYFDAQTGLLADGRVPGPEYPLAHRALRLRIAAGVERDARSDAESDAGSDTDSGTADGTGADAGGPREVCTWGVDPATAERRALWRAFAAVLAARDPRPAADGVSPLVAAASPEAADALARAHAWAMLPAYRAAHPPQPVALTTTGADASAGHVSSDAGLQGADAQRLLRLIHLCTGALPVLWRSGNARAGACFAWVRLGPWTVAAVADSPSAACCEALGEAMSAWQLGRLSADQASLPLALLRAIPLEASAPDTAAAEAGPDPAEADGWAVQSTAIEDPLLPADVHVAMARVHAA